MPFFFRRLGFEIGHNFGARRFALHLGQVQHNVIGPKGNIIRIEIFAGSGKVGQQCLRWC